MEHDHITKHTMLIKHEDKLLEQIDTCQQLLAAMWQFLRSFDDTIHIPTDKRLFTALRTVERHIDDELLDVRLDLLPYATCRKTDPSHKNNALG